MRVQPTNIQCPKPAPGVRTRRRDAAYILHDVPRDQAYELNATAGLMWILFNR